MHAAFTPASARRFGVITDPAPQPQSTTMRSFSLMSKLSRIFSLCGVIISSAETLP